MVTYSGIYAIAYVIASSGLLLYSIDTYLHSPTLKYTIFSQKFVLNLIKMDRVDVIQILVGIKGK